MVLKRKAEDVVLAPFDPGLCRGALSRGWVRRGTDFGFKSLDFGLQGSAGSCCELRKLHVPVYGTVAHLCAAFSIDAAMLLGEAIVWNGKDGSDSNVVAAIDLSSIPDCTDDLIAGWRFEGLVQKA